MPERNLLTVAAAAKHAAVSTRTIHRWIKSGQLPAYRVGPRGVRVDAADLEPQPIGQRAS